jgi:hypothetical protein
MGDVLILAASVANHASASDSVTASVRTSLAVHLILTAAKFTRKVKEIETAHIGKEVGEVFEDIISYALSTILSSTAALEGYVNEIFVDRSTHFPEYNQQLIDDIWAIKERRRIIEKYNFVLSLKDKGRFETKQKYYKDAELLIDLRNALVHFKPEWSHEKGKHKELMTRLNNKFPSSPFYKAALTVFPDSFMSYGCAKWSVTTTVNFIGKFSEMADIENKLDKYHDRLSLE